MILPFDKKLLNPIYWIFFQQCNIKKKYIYIYIYITIILIIIFLIKYIEKADI